MPKAEPGACVYGQHLLLRLGSVELQPVLDNPAEVAAFLSGLVALVGMRVLAGPYVATEDTDPARYGHSGVVILYESHAAIHTYPRRRELFLDIFSCRPFATDCVLQACREHFGEHEVLECTLLDRGQHWSLPGLARLQEWMPSS